MQALFWGLRQNTIPSLEEITIEEILKQRRETQKNMCYERSVNNYSTTQSLPGIEDELEKIWLKN